MTLKTMSNADLTAYMRQAGHSLETILAVQDEWTNRIHDICGSIAKSNQVISGNLALVSQ